SPDTFSLQVEIAENPRQRRQGLSRRAELPANEGMIFLFTQEQPAGTSFWMYGTSIPLSIAFLDHAWVIREIRHLRPCRSPLPLLCPTYRSGSPFSAALEVSQGYFERRGIEVGARVLLRREPPH
ncbi:MAG: DUF192 domain-containing protein, partial [Gemmatimonadetes bacterium]|nr:DUF192 domain-containing protein [Gemmatimonadota bacterium]